MTDRRAESAYDRIYAVIASIPEGRVATYGQVAALAGLPGHARQVGYALHSSPAGLELPWQRVINSKGEVSLRSDPGLDEGYQRHLLEEEGVIFTLAGRVDLEKYQWEPEERPRKPAKRR
jgi:methylated-DNA-protein-cysteine methyltransferase-like protein